MYILPGNIQQFYYDEQKLIKHYIIDAADFPCY